MHKVTFLPQNVTVEIEEGKSILDAAEDNGVALDHACGGNCACSTCHVWVRQGKEHLNEIGDEEAEQLDEAWGLNMHSRLGCQCRPTGDVVVEIPEYTVNMVKSLH